ncbi:MAG: response regulator [Alphaproteobacteria bacterium]
MANVLVVDDEILAARALARFFDRLDFDVTMATGYVEAMLAWARRPVDLVVTDLRMPDGSGLDLVRQIRDSNHSVPIIVMTGHVLSEAETQVLEAGANIVFRKPIDLYAMRRSVAELVPSPEGR